jgi:hypothetical protein
MTQISYPTREPSPLSPRTAKYVAALMREGDNLDYDKWFQGVREEEAQAKKVRATFTSGKIAATEIGNPISVSGFRGALPNRTLMTETVPITGRIRRSHQEPGGKTPKARLRRRLEKVRDAWDDFQVSRTRDAVYGFLGAVFEMVMHYKVRRRTTRLRRHAFKFADLPLNNSSDIFTAVIRCTTDDNADNKIISKMGEGIAVCRSLRCAADAVEDVYEGSGWGECVC